MPELPEVECIRRSLTPYCPFVIAEMRLSAVAPLVAVTAAELRTALAQHTITRIARRGKYLLLHLETESILVIHLGMTGQLRWHAQPPSSPHRHTHLQLIASNGSGLHYIDPRRFGVISLHPLPDGRPHPTLERLGPEYDAVAATDFIARCRRHARLTLKSLLLHQGVVPGIGNIYACEALYRAGLDPRRLVQATSDEALRHLLAQIRATLDLGIAKGGTTLRDYVDGHGHRGAMKDFLHVYDREGQSSLDGRGRVIRIMQNARSTFFAPAVQT